MQNEQDRGFQRKVRKTRNVMQKAIYEVFDKTQYFTQLEPTKQSPKRRRLQRYPLHINCFSFDEKPGMMLTENHPIASRKQPTELLALFTSKMTQSPYRDVRRYVHSQHLQSDAEIGTRIQENRQMFETFVIALSRKWEESSVPAHSPEVQIVLACMNIAKDASGRALIHAVGHVDASVNEDESVPFEEAAAQPMSSKHS
jgi:hypothetical protein